ncbi:unnamed protein product, partial [Ectocarpus sp. 12 AP-2014]
REGACGGAHQSRRRPQLPERLRLGTPGGSLPSWLCGHRRAVGEGRGGRGPHPRRKGFLRRAHHAGGSAVCPGSGGPRG